MGGTAFVALTFRANFYPQLFHSPIFWYEMCMQPRTLQHTRSVSLARNVLRAVRSTSLAGHEAKGQRRVPHR